MSTTTTTTTTTTRDRGDRYGPMEWAQQTNGCFTPPPLRLPHPGEGSRPLSLSYSQFTPAERDATHVDRRVESCRVV